MKHKRKPLILILFLMFTSSILILFFLPKPHLLEGVPFSTAIYDNKHHLIKLTLSADEKYRLFVPLSDISKTMINSTLLQEDRAFHWHMGVNPWSMVKAFWQTYVVKSRRQGASTITMQVAHLIYKINTKKMSGKFLQMIRALQLEMHYSKAAILEAYLNLAPYGRNIEGVGAASLIYFDCAADQLLLPQALTLSVMPQNPNGRHSGNPQLQTMRNRLFARWIKDHPEDGNQSQFMSLPLAMRALNALPDDAPHFVNTVLQKEKTKNNQINTTLDLEMQKKVTYLLRNYVARKKMLGVDNAAALVVDTRDMGVRALVGSAHFFNNNIGGQINGTAIKRSPGSTLKPFIYALALDQGLIHPYTLLKDVPSSFNGYNPENFDYDFMGPIKAKDALVLSRNIPAIELSNQLKNPSLYQLLEEAKISKLRSETFYGLALTLGGAELTMQELATLYAMLANLGQWAPLRFTQSDTLPSPKRLLSAEASFLVLDMLKESTTSSLRMQHPDLNAVSWKTGTSSGFRDAWAIGKWGPYVLAVWMGNFDNRANPALIGKEIAAPLFFELMNAIKQMSRGQGSYSVDLSHLNIKKIKVCSASGMLPTRACTQREWTWFIPGKSPITRDTLFREVPINAITGRRTCHINADTRFEVFEFWSSDLLEIFKKAGIQRHTPPPFEPGCEFSDAIGKKPVITSPQKTVHYVIQINQPHATQIPFSAVSDAGVKSLYWFVNETFLGKTKPNVPFIWQAKPGSFTVRVLDDRGLSDVRTLYVDIVG